MLNQLKGRSDVFLSLGRRCANLLNSKVQTPEKAREDGIESRKVNVSWYCH